MMKRLVWLLLAGGVGLGSTAISRADTYDNLTFTLSNGGVIAGSPGATVGWGFTLTNSENYVVISASEFDTTQNGGDGTYSDFIGPDFVVVGPANGFGDLPTVTQDFGLNSGVGSFTISPTATIGDIVLGESVLTFDVYSVSPDDPSFNPIVDTLANGLEISAPAKVLVTPEPPTGLLLLAAGLGLLVRRPRRLGA
jgi:hypothetical protein